MEVKNDLPPVGLVEGASAARRKIAVFADSPVGGPIDPQSRSAARAAARTLEKLGHHVEEIAPPFDAGVLLDFGVLWSAGAAEVVGKWEKQAGRTATYDDFEPFTLALTAEFGKVKDQFSAVLARLRSFEAIYEAKFSDYDVLLSPTLGAPPPEIGYLSTAYRYETVAQRLSDYVCFTPYMNISGAPAISLPLGMSKQKLPIGVQLAAAKGQERTLLELAYELEAASPWSNRTPPLFA
jgi:amidase